MKIEIKKDKEGWARAVKLIPENKEEHKIFERFWEKGIWANDYDYNSGQLELVFNNPEKKENKELKK